nr:hypothetical protein [Candidatus Njordarchaeum guaymaensis]
MQTKECMIAWLWAQGHMSNLGRSGETGEEAALFSICLRGAPVSAEARTNAKIAARERQ